MKKILPILLLLLSIRAAAQTENYTSYPTPIPVQDKKIEVSRNYDGKPTLVWREIKMQEPSIIQALIKSLIDTTRKNIYLAYNGIKDSIPQAQLTTMERVLFSEMYPDSVNRILIIEQWDLNKETNKMAVKILGIAPACMLGGKYHPLFWNRYNDIEILLRKLPGGFKGELTVTAYDVFKQRLFTSKIIKTLP